MNRRDFANALDALERLYAGWGGGPSPDTADEARAVATALRLEPVTNDALLHGIWEAEAANIGELARLHLEALGVGGDR